MTSRKPKTQATPADDKPVITAGEGGTASESSEGQALTSAKTGDEGALDPKTEKAARNEAKHGGLDAARDRLKRERGWTDAQVASLNDDAVYDSLAQIDAKAERTQQEQDRLARRNEQYQQQGADAGMSSGYTRGSADSGE